MLVHFMPSSSIIVAMLVICLVLVLAFEATNGFHDSSNAVATVIYTQSLKPGQAVIWSGLMNFVGVLVGATRRRARRADVARNLRVGVVLECSYLGIRHTE